MSVVLSACVTPVRICIAAASRRSFTSRVAKAIASVLVLSTFICATQSAAAQQVTEQGSKLTATPASGPLPLFVKFTMFVAQGDTNTYSVNFGDGTSSGPMVRSPSGIACTVRPPCYTGIASTSHTYTSAPAVGSVYQATLLNSALQPVAMAIISVTGPATRARLTRCSASAISSPAPCCARQVFDYGRKLGD